MNVFRLSRAKYANDLSGKGAENNGGRWNSIGTAMLYTSESRALCSLEARVHMTQFTIPDDYVMLTIELPKHFLIQEITLADLPNNWVELTEDPRLQILGDRFIQEGKFAVLKVPSAIQPKEFNYLINPQFKSELQFSSEPHVFDKRLFA